MRLSPFFTRRSLPVGENKGEPCSMPAVKSCRLRPLARAAHPLFAMSLLLCSPAWADEPVRRTYQVAPASLGAALTRFADQAGVSLSLDPALVQGRQSAGLSGAYSVDEGFAQLLRGSGLQWLPVGEGAFTLVPAPRPVAPWKSPLPVSSAGWSPLANRSPTLAARWHARAHKACSARGTSWKPPSASPVTPARWSRTSRPAPWAS